MGDRLLPIPLFSSRNLKVGLLSCLRHWKYRDICTAFEAFAESHCAFDGCEDGVIFALAYAFTWPPFVAALTRDDVARDRVLTTVKFYTKTATG